MDVMVANVAGNPAHDFVQLQVAGGLHRRSASRPCLRRQDAHVLEAVLSEEQVTADHRRYCHRQQNNEKRSVEAAEYPQHRNQRTVTDQHQQRIPVPGRILQKWQYRDAEKEDSEIPRQYGQRMALDPVGETLDEGSVAPHIGSHGCEGANGGSVDLAYMTMVIIVAVLP